jgi:hypothetical protein
MKADSLRHILRIAGLVWIACLGWWFLHTPGKQNQHNRTRAASAFIYQQF